MSRKLFGIFGFVAALGLSAVFGASANAGYTTINPPIVAGEQSHLQIFKHYYGAGVTASALDFTGGAGGVSLVRVEDTHSPSNGVLGVGSGVAGDAADQVWHDGFISATAKARYARFAQNFGYLLGASGNSYTNLFNTTNQGYAVTGSNAVDLTGKTWRWARRGTEPLLNDSSLPTDNTDGLDHMVTYQVFVDGKPTPDWWLCFEDLNLTNNPVWLPTSDRDFQDLVVEVTAVPVPLPLAAFSGLGTMAGLGIAGAVRRMISIA